MYYEHQFLNPIFEWIPEHMIFVEIVEAMGFDVQWVSPPGDESEWLDQYDNDTATFFMEWTPTVPEGWTLAGKYDTEDGPTALLVKPKESPAYTRDLAAALFVAGLDILGEQAGKQQMTGTRQARTHQASPSSGIVLIAQERARQVGLGWSAEHDARHLGGTLIRAAIAYATDATRHQALRKNVPMGWPWKVEDWHPGTKVRELVKAGALIAAEIDRLQALGFSEESDSPGEAPK